MSVIAIDARKWPKADEREHRFDQPLPDTMTAMQSSPASAFFSHVSLLLAVALARLVHCQDWTQVDNLSVDNWQTIKNFTVANGVVNYEIKSFTIEDQIAREISMVIQKNDAELVKDLAICGNVAYTIDSTRVFIQPLNPRLFSVVGLYGPKLLRQTSDTVLNGKKSIAYDQKRQRLLFSQQSRIEAVDYCKQSHHAQTTIRRDTDVSITKIAIDPSRGILLWTESADIDHFRVMMASIDGENMTKLYESNASQCTAMTVHSQAGLVYWVSQQQLWSMPYARPGSARLVLRNDNLITDSIQIDPSQNYLYWSSMQRKVLRAPLDLQALEGKVDKVQLISQLGGQHLLLVAFRVSSSESDEKEDRCVPLCQTPKKTDKSNMGNGEEYEATLPPTLSGHAVWAELRHYQWSPKAVAELLITTAVVVAVAVLLYASITLLRVCLRPRY